ncbi:MAG: hypothetical protein ABIK09_14040 [Pseudomonadota bacterium]
MQRSLWMVPRLGLLLVLLGTPGCPDSPTNPPTDPSEDTAPEEVVGRDTERWDAPPLDAYTSDSSDAGGDGCPSDACLLPPAPPEIRGEPSAGHPHPTWLWTLPEGAVSSRVRLDGGPWEELAPEMTSYTAEAALEPGVHLFEVQAIGTDGQVSEPGTFETLIETFERPGYWNGVARDPARSPLGNLAAISAHNCYLAFIDPASSLQATRTMIQAAVEGGADLIELDIREEGGAILVDHDDDGSLDGALLANVLDLPELRDGDQVLFLEIKETQPTEVFIAGLLDLLDARRECYARNGRPVVLRTFLSLLPNVALARQLLDGGAYPLIEHYVRLSVLFGNNDFPALATFQETIALVASDGYGMVEFQYQDRNLFGKLAFARSLGLGTNVWTVPVSMGAVFATALREEVDAITTDLSTGAARAAVEADNVLVYLNARGQPADGDAVTWHQADGVVAQAGINGPGQPSSAAWGTGEGLFGTVLEFHPWSSEFLPLYDADCSTDGGVLVTAAVRFDRLALDDGETMVVLAKSDMAGWTLELHDPPGVGGAELRFGVFVDGLYRYASVPADWVLNEADGFFLIGAYDGDGQVRLWVDDDDDAVVGEEASGGVVNNDSLVLLGADPHGDAAPRFHLDGAVQQAAVLRWDSL